MEGCSFWTLKLISGQVGIIPVRVEDPLMLARSITRLWGIVTRCIVLDCLIIPKCYGIGFPLETARVLKYLKFSTKKVQKLKASFLFPALYASNKYPVHIQ